MKTINTFFYGYLDPSAVSVVCWTFVRGREVGKCAMVCMYVNEKDCVVW